MPRRFSKRGKESGAFFELSGAFSSPREPFSSSNGSFSSPSEPFPSPSGSRVGVFEPFSSPSGSEGVFSGVFWPRPATAWRPLGAQWEPKERDPKMEPGAGLGRALGPAEPHMGRFWLNHEKTRKNPYFRGSERLRGSQRGGKWGLPGSW